MPIRRQLFFPVLVILIVLGLKLWLHSERYLQLNLNYIHDDGRYFATASSMMRGEWLGPADSNFTLMRGPGYPLLIAFSSLSRIQLVHLHLLLWLGATASVGWACYRWSGRWWVAGLGWAILVLNPVHYYLSFADTLVRQHLHLPVAMLAVTATLMIAHHLRDGRLSWSWLVVLGSAVGLLPLIRGEAIWITPLVVLVGGRFFWALWQSYRDRHWPACRRWGLAITLLLVTSQLPPTVIRLVNWQYYGVALVDELSSPALAQAYQALTHIQAREWLPRIPVQTETRQQLYRLSPRFAELEAYLEGPLGYAWTQNSAELMKLYPYSNPYLAWRERQEMAGGWFIFAFRDAVAAAGYYQRPELAQQYYRQLSAEIKQLCRNRVLTCLPALPGGGYLPPLSAAHLPYLWQSGQAAVRLIVQSPPVNDVTLPASQAQPAELAAAQLFLTDRRVVPTVDQPLDQRASFRQKGQLIRTMSQIYSWLLPVTLLLAILIFLWRWVHRRHRHQATDLLWTQTGILLAALSLTLIVALIDATSFPAIYYEYLAPAQMFVIIFILTTLLPLEQAPITSRQSGKLLPTRGTEVVTRAKGTDASRPR